MLDLERIVKLNELVVWDEELLNSSDGDLQVGEDGVLSGPAAAAQEKYLGFMEDDAIKVLAVCAGTIDKKGDEPEIAARYEDEMRAPFAKALVMPLPLPDMLLEELAELEAKMLIDGVVDCVNCNDYVGVGGRCPGIIEKGDLLKGLLGAALNVGMQWLSHRAILLQEANTPKRLTPEALWEKLTRDPEWEQE